MTFSELECSLKDKLGLMRGLLYAFLAFELLAPPFMPFRGAQIIGHFSWLKLEPKRGK